MKSTIKTIIADYFGFEEKDCLVKAINTVDFECYHKPTDGRYIIDRDDLLVFLYDKITLPILRDPIGGGE